MGIELWYCLHDLVSKCYGIDSQKGDIRCMLSWQKKLQWRWVYHSFWCTHQNIYEMKRENNKCDMWGWRDGENIWILLVNWDLRL